MGQYIKIRKSWLIAFLIGLLVIISVFSNIRFEGFRTDALGGDSRGYYAWLPAVFIHHTLDFEEVRDIQKKMHGAHYQGHYYSDYQGTLINKYTSGVALLILPFFLLALLFSYIFGLPPDGYSILFQYSVVLAGIFYASLGLYFSYKLLRGMGFNRSISLFSVFTFLLGTNLFYYTFFHPGMSHVYAFGMGAFFLYSIHRAMNKRQDSAFLTASLALGLSILIRPFNALLVLIIPFIAVKPEDLGKVLPRMISSGRLMLYSLLPFLVLIGLQAFIYYSQTGQLWVWTYPGEGFDFSSPEFSNVLFSYRKGLFVYAPLLLIAILGFIPLFRKNYFRGFYLLGFLLLISWLISSWWNWFYGDSFGMRPFIDYYPLFIILFTYLISSVGKRMRKFLFTPLILLLIILNLIQSYQYEHRIIHHDAMTKEKYWYVFLKTGKQYEEILGDTRESLFKESPLRPLDTFLINYDSVPKKWVLADSLIVADRLDSNNYVYLIDSAIHFSSTLKLDAKKDTTVFKHKRLYAKAEFSYYESDTNAAVKSFLVSSVSDHNGLTAFYKSFRIKDYPDDTLGFWRKADFGYEINLPEKPKEMRFYVWNPDDARFLLDDWQIILFSIEEGAELRKGQDLR